MTSILVTTGESRTGIFVAQNLVDDQASCKKYIDQVCVVMPSNVTSAENITKYGAKLLQMDVATLSANEIADALKKNPVHSVVLIPPASADKVEVAHKLAQAVRTAGESAQQLKNVVLVSVMGADEAGTTEPELQKFAKIEEDAKKVLSGANLHCCIVRTAPYLQNLVLYAKQIKQHGFLGLPVDDKAVTMVDARDVGAAVAAIASAKGKPEMDPEYRGKVLNLTGVEALTGKQMTEKMAEVKELKPLLSKGFKSISREEGEAYLSSIPNLDRSENMVTQDQFDLARAGKLSVTTNDLKNVLDSVNIEPRTFTEFITEYGSEFTAAPKEE